MSQLARSERESSGARGDRKPGKGRCVVHASDASSGLAGATSGAHDYGGIAGVFAANTWSPRLESGLC